MTYTVEPPQIRIITMQAITFLHPGTGQTTGVVDLPVQREVHTEFPIYSASGLKGALRDKAETSKWGIGALTVKTLFGGDLPTDNQAPPAGSLTLTDARILAFPVRSLQHVFFWVTCPMVINRLKRDTKLVGPPETDIPEISGGPGIDKAWVTQGAGVTNPLVLEDIALEPQSPDAINQIAHLIQTLAGEDSGFDANRLAILTNEDFKYFIRHATQISARIKLNKDKTTTGEGGNLWYEETLPPETILYALALCHKPRLPANGSGRTEGDEPIESATAVAQKVEELLNDHFLQIGGNETVGQGWCRMNVHNAVIEKKQESCDE